ncbi:zinc finger CCCH domain-containing protein 6 [Phtheirospermum japonicum]|uniref:Zinc finger CCCH domain-containing protein 6 n=1 Tax=Phtheirospermum japonicum TaxID=374723 RepID=A0A830D666_9LAMI|nr:zinc finger CCCH domain-containing protein 6 [Phtheirospermum japonicum]
MGRSQKTKRISWASDVNLCQVRLFLSEESPSQVVLGTQEHLQAGKNESDENLPSGFGQTQLANPWRVKLSQIPLMKWRRPCRFEVNIEWEVVAGEESKEVMAQNQREMRVLEAIYPRPSSIPPNPSVLVNAEDSIANEENTPVVPVTPIEDDDDTPNSTTLQPQISQAALTSVLSNSAPGNLVDRDLLIKILSDPKMVEQLVSSHHARNVPSIGMPKYTSFCAQNKPPNGTQYNTPSLRPPPTNNAYLTSATQNGPFYPTPQIRMGPSTDLRPVASPSPGAPLKDINYCKSLIQQHGIERQDVSPSQEQHLNVVKSKLPKMMKPCMYFKSPKGCRNGANCAYQHDGSARNRVIGFPEVHNAKRMKSDGGIVGR